MTAHDAFVAERRRQRRIARRIEAAVLILVLAAAAYVWFGYHPERADAAVQAAITRPTGSWGSDDPREPREGGRLMYVEMVDPQRVMLDEIADRRLTRDDVAMTYAFALRQANEVDFAVVNRAIMDRWSIAALRYIKDKAWRIARGNA
jgi:hypothetical protein